MRPLKLTMAAFGPFAGREEVDFTQLGENPLFLINGPTGSGKTTILDAICFSLYGKTTGDERDASQMRCDLATVDVLTEVTLVFELAGTVYRIHRLPEQQRPKTKGDGFTDQKPEAHLSELLADGSEKLLVSSKVTEATRQIEELTGLSVDQFRQVMVLPQGKFRQLLLAESAEREKIFSQLFQTRIYKRLEESLKERSARIRRERSDLQQVQQGVLEAVDAATEQLLVDEIQSLETQLDQSLHDKNSCESQFVSAANALQQATAVKADFIRLEKVTADLTELHRQAVEIDRQRQQLQRAERAGLLQPLFADRQRCESELQQATVALEQAVQQRQTTAQQLQLAVQQLELSQTLQVKLDAAKRQAIQLGGYRDRAKQLLVARNQFQAARQQQVSAEIGVRHKQLVEQLLHYQQLEQLEREYIHQEKLLEQKKQQGTELGQQAEQLEQQVKHQELSWHRGQAAILAAELEEGKPCPVCGSVEHPAPTQSEQLLPTQQQVEQARKKAQQVHSCLQVAREEYGETQRCLYERKVELDRCRKDLNQVTGESMTELKQQLSHLQQQAEEQNCVLLSSSQVQQFDLVSLQQKNEQLREIVLRAEADVAAAENELPEEFRTAGMLEAAEQKIAQQIGQLELQLSAIADQHQRALGSASAAEAAALAAENQRIKNAQELASAVEKFKLELGKSCFADEQSFQAALLSEQASDNLKKQLELFDAECQRLTGAQQQLQLALNGKDLPDLGEYEKRLVAAEQSRNSAVALWQRFDNRHGQLVATYQKLQKIAVQLAEFDRQYAVVGTLSDVANGQTGNKISLQRFVLSVLLDDVLIEASQRLSLMSKGRYKLLRNEQRSKGNKASGLELEVEDAYTGKQRAVATLSGGESFMAALSLALGLSDVVQAYAGGIRLDTLFIDEGFGSLDSESLDLAVRTLIDLQSSGRMVGVISHIAELKEQLSMRIDVDANHAGSHIRLHI